MTTITLPEGLFINDGAAKVDGVPIGALVTDPEVARMCVRCGHEECPCCGSFCDHCINDDLGPRDRIDGDFIVHVYGDNGETRHHKDCARELSCVFDRDRHPLMHEIENVRSIVFANVGGSFGVTEDRRVWFAGRTHEQEDRRERAKERRNKIVMSRRTTKMSKLKELFSKMSNDQRAAYLEGMRHAEMLVEWAAEDAKLEGKQMSKKAIDLAYSKVGQGILAMENADNELTVTGK